MLYVFAVKSYRHGPQWVSAGVHTLSTSFPQGIGMTCETSRMMWKWSAWLTKLYQRRHFQFPLWCPLDLQLARHEDTYATQELQNSRDYLQASSITHTISEWTSRSAFSGLSQGLDVLTAPYKRPIQNQFAGPPMFSTTDHKCVLFQATQFCG